MSHIRKEVNIMTDVNKPTEEKSVRKGENAWYTQAYKLMVISSILDDWHPDVYKNFDPEKWVKLIASTGAETVTLQSKSHSGNAYYQTELEYYHMDLKGRDAFGELLELFHQ